MLPPFVVGMQGHAVTMLRLRLCLICLGFIRWCSLFVLHSHVLGSHCTSCHYPLGVCVAFACRLGYNGYFSKLPLVQNCIGFPPGYIYNFIFRPALSLSLFTSLLPLLFRSLGPLSFTYAWGSMFPVVCPLEVPNLVGISLLTVTISLAITSL